MINKVYKIIDSLNISGSENILCAVSGGIDSVVMLYCLYEYGFNCIVAHCNFKLRGEESDNDEVFVKNLADKLEFKFISEKFDTGQYARKAGVSIQMAARDLRFEWFYEMSEKYNCKYIALAHNSDDQIETVLYNLIRGTGIKGLCGMKTIKGKLFRPLLEIQRKEIEKFAKENHIEYRTDSTNIKTEYSRNKIRHLIFPLFNQINPNFRQNIFNTSNYLKDVAKIYEDYILTAKQNCVKYAEDKVYINIDKLKKTHYPETVLFEIFSYESLPNSFAAEALDLLNSQSGKACIYRNIEVLKDREHIIIRTNYASKKSEEYFIEKNIKEINIPINLKFEEIKITENFEIIKNPNYAMLDVEKIKFPLKLRKWQEGDKFKPLGMDNLKKLSDFFTDNKLNLFQKSELWLLTSANEIVWIVGHRIDNRFKITENTSKAIVVKFSK